MLFLLHNLQRFEHPTGTVVDLHEIAVDKPHGEQPASPIRAGNAPAVLLSLAFLDVLALHVNAVAAEMLGKQLTQWSEEKSGIMNASCVAGRQAWEFHL